ncbi:hypothetical protein KUTeg_006453 [Tegillarca granosa]|uniref:Uncharacterized protein n=1 Tax=Tegillarca granosa TaxID=220873 RepID=A0ABQ9FGN0_TEGGR|nr:hypothetical protein KUTeg_006453 [Tegillarca granosa]
MSMCNLYQFCIVLIFVSHTVTGVPTSRPSLTGYDGSPRFPGNTITLTCKVDGGTPLATLSWTCKGLLVQGTNANTATSAIRTYIVTIDTSYNGQQCQCSASHLQWTEDIIAKIPAFIVQYPPTSNPVLSGYDGSVRYKDPPSTPNLNPSTSTPFPWIEAGQGTLDCKSQPGNPPTITYQWIRQNVVIQGQTGESLIITSLTRNDNRKSYKCKVSNDYTVHKNEDLISQPIQLYVEYRPVISIDPPSVHAVISPSFTQEGEGVKMTCLARGVPDHYTYNGWTQVYRNTVIRSSNDFLSLSKNRQNISLPIVTYQDIGIYKCSATNGILDENGNIDKEAIFNSSTKFYAEINRNLVVNIPFVCNPQAATVHNISLTKKNVDQKGMNGIAIDLKRRSVDIKFYEKVIDVNGQEVVITFNSVNSNLQGTYTVGVRNLQEAQVSTFAFQVLLTGPPDHPKNFKLLSSSTDSVVVTWLAGSNNGHQQTFVLSYQQTSKIETLKTKNITGIGGKELYVASIDNLLPETQYSFWIYASNIKGNTMQYIDSANVIGIKTKTLKFCKSNSDDNKNILIGIVIGIIVGVIAQGMKCGTSASQQEMQYEETSTGNNHEDLSNQQQYEDLCNRQDSDAYQELHLKGAEAIQMSSVFENTVVNSVKFLERTEINQR